MKPMENNINDTICRGTIQPIVKSLEPMNCIHFIGRNGNCNLTKPRMKCRDRIKAIYKHINYSCLEYREE